MAPPELELELVKSYMAQKPMLRGEVGARALRVRPVSREGAWASAGVQGHCSIADTDSIKPIGKRARKVHDEYTRAVQALDEEHGHRGALRGTPRSAFVAGRPRSSSGCRPFVHSATPTGVKEEHFT